MARVISYTRVSSQQQTRGASLGDQDDRIKRWRDDNQHTIIASYSEHGSGRSAKNRREFMRMMEDVKALRPDILICDASDRFTRNALDGGRWLSELTDLGVRLAIIEHEDGRVLNMNVYADRAYVSNAFIIADGERERMSQRHRKWRALATTKVNNPPWGLLLEPGARARRRLVPHPERVSVIHEIDERILRGESIAKVLEWLKGGGHPRCWKAPSSLAQMLKDKNNSYVIAGARSAETQSALREVFSGRRHVHGRNRQRNTPDPLESLRPSLREHVLSGLVACGKCVAAGRVPREALMAGYYAHGNANPWALACVGLRGGTQLHDRWSINILPIAELIGEKLDKLQNDAVADAVLERWRTEPVTERSSSEREALERQLAACDEDEATLEAQVVQAFKLFGHTSPAVKAEAERMLERSHANRLALSAKRASYSARLADLPAPRVRRLSGVDRNELRLNAAAVLVGKQIDPVTGTGWVDIDTEEAFGKWVRLIGPPVINRGAGTGGRRTHAAPFMTWDFIDAVMPEPATEIMPCPV